MTAKGLHPWALRDIETWCEQTATPPHEGRRRFVEFVVLDCVGASSLFGPGLVLKGGNALRFVYGSPRSTLDLDFTAYADRIRDEEKSLREDLDGALRRAQIRYGVKARCQRVKRDPRRDDATRPTYSVNVGYQFPTDRYFHNFDKQDVSTVVPLQISLYDLVCEALRHRLIDESPTSILVCSLEDILAEKLRSLLQQPLRGRHRSQDVYDIARYFMARGSSLDRDKIAHYLHQKAGIRDVHVTRSAFDDDVRNMAAVEYDTRVREQAGEHFIPFGGAWATVITLVDSLSLPE